MKILHLESSPGWGGQEMRSLNEALGMSKRGHKIIFAIEKKGGLVNKAKKEGFLVYELPYKKVFWPFTFFCLIWIILKNKVSIINTHSSNDAWIGGIVARLFRKKIIRTRHLSTKIRSGLNSYFLYNVLADFIVTTCKKIIPMIYLQSKKKPQFCCSIPTGVEIDKIKIEKEEILAFKRKYNLEKEPFLVGTACFMRSWKGIDDFIQAAHLLRDKENLKWVIIGGGHADTYIKKVKDLNLEDKIIFTGHLDLPYHAIAALDVFMLLSTAHEGVSQSILQAAYLQKPLIGTPIGGIGEVCINQKTGFIVPPHSPEDIKEAVLKLRKNVFLRQEMGKEAKNLVLTSFTHQKMLDSMENVYEKIMIKTKN